MTNPKFIYKSEKPYTEDINDLVEKGGAGSGQRGHITNHPEWGKFWSNTHNLGPMAHQRSIKRIHREMTGKTNKEIDALHDKAKMHEEAFKRKMGSGE